MANILVKKQTLCSLFYFTFIFVMYLFYFYFKIKDAHDYMYIYICIQFLFKNLYFHKKLYGKTLLFTLFYIFNLNVTLYLFLFRRKNKELIIKLKINLFVIRLFTGPIVRVFCTVTFGVSGIRKVVVVQVSHILHECLVLLFHVSGCCCPSFCHVFSSLGSRYIFLELFSFIFQII